MATICSAKTIRGEVCRAKPLYQGTRCFAHSADPKVRYRRDEARRAGGRARMRQVKTFDSTIDEENPPEWFVLSSIADATHALAHVARSSLVGRLEPRAANAITGTLGAMIAAIRDSSLEARVAEMEAALVLSQGDLRAND
jgi:hypothetical protein